MTNKAISVTCKRGPWISSVRHGPSLTLWSQLSRLCPIWPFAILRILCCLLSNWRSKNRKTQKQSMSHSLILARVEVGREKCPNTRDLFQVIQLGLWGPRKGNQEGERSQLMSIKGRWREVERVKTGCQGVPKTTLRFDDLQERLLGPRKPAYTYDLLQQKDTG